MLQLRLAPDMLPFHFQIGNVVHQSVGALQAVESGAFRGPPPLETDFAGLEAHIAQAHETLRNISPDAVNAYEGADVIFDLPGGVRLAYTAENFIQSFALPNFYFHATAAYSLLRHQGMVLGKRDFLGRTRVKP